MRKTLNAIRITSTVVNEGAHFMFGSVQYNCVLRPLGIAIINPFEIVSLYNNRTRSFSVHVPAAPPKRNVMFVFSMAIMAC